MMLGAMWAAAQRYKATADEALAVPDDPRTA